MASSVSRLGGGLALAALALAIAQGACAAVPGKPCPPGLAADYGRAHRVVAVDAAGGVPFTSIQEAVDSTLESGCRSRVEIRIAPGHYRERLVIPFEAPPLTLRGMGESARETVVVANLRSDELAKDGQRLGSYRAATLWVASDDHIFTNLAFVNASVELWDETGGRPAARLRTGPDRFVLHFQKLPAGTEST